MCSDVGEYNFLWLLKHQVYWKIRVDSAFSFPHNSQYFLSSNTEVPMDFPWVKYAHRDTEPEEYIHISSWKDICWTEHKISNKHIFLEFV
jgi:hypothetical protein